jgi:hypothetical protein
LIWTLMIVRWCLLTCRKTSKKKILYLIDTNDHHRT